MTNAERNKDALREAGYSFSVTKDGEIANCGRHDCIGSNCQFYKDTSCGQARINWLLAEAKQPRKEVLKVLDETEGQFSVLKETEEVVECGKNRAQCESCEFSNYVGQCANNRYKWLREHGFIKEE